MRFFLGSLALDVPDVPEGVRIQQFDGVFLRPVLPVTEKATVRIIGSEVLTIPANAVPLSLYVKTWTERGAECRAYMNREECRYISRLDGNDVTVQVRKSYLDTFWAEFRPWFCIHLEELCLNNQALILHSASIEYRGGGVIFTAPSGTGKTTQTDLWHEHLKDVTDINGDRTLLQRTGEGWFACGFPLYGSVLRCEQKARPIKAIVIVRQGPENQVQELSPVERAALLYSECTIPSTERYASLAMDLLTDLVQTVRVVRYVCNMEPDAVTVLHRYLYGG